VTNNGLHRTDVPVGMKGQHFNMPMPMLETFDDEQPKPKPSYNYHTRSGTILSDIPQLIPAEDVSSDEDTATVSWHIHGCANAIYSCCSTAYRLQLRNQTARIVRQRV